MTEETKKDTKVATPQEPQKETKKQASKKEVNAAIVYDRKREVRRYTLDVHGKSFKKLAEKYAEHKGYQVVTERIEEGIVCPACGHVFQS